MDVNDMIKDEDLIANKFNSHGSGTVPRYYTSQSLNQIQQLVANMVPNFISKRLSARELNLLKRKAKINAKDQSKSWSEEEESEVLQSRLPKVVTCADQSSSTWEVRHGSMMVLREVLSQQGGSAGVFMRNLSSENSYIFEGEEKYTLNTLKRERELDLNVQVDAEESEPDWKRQKFEDLSHPLISITATINKEVDLGVDPDAYLDNGFCFHTKEVGDTVKQISYCQATSSTPEIGTPSHPGDSKLTKLVTLTRNSWLRNWEFLQECAICFLCVFSLDRFGDYVSDQVVAPVRETCAQSLGTVLKYMHPLLVHETLKILLQMQRRPEWEIRHGSLLGMKYLVAVRRVGFCLTDKIDERSLKVTFRDLGGKHSVEILKEMLDDLLCFILPACKFGLEDPDDDVRAVAAEALVPAAGAIVSLNGQMLHSIVMLLWDILRDLDDLSPSTSRFTF
ncbi:hypothetical protein GIB67_034512 [Kingdonia uniflora]|uniref:Mot1 central domain-containing protein n=1 Tax=Kingdonia uniflora TaxID=39325 RepID=A0A7J7PBE2_9MAGN|nr:hypothetical protein GIB67_034512 [Kingdonia uniflora]